MLHNLFIELNANAVATIIWEEGKTGSSYYVLEIEDPRSGCPFSLVGGPLETPFDVGGEIWAYLNSNTLFEIRNAWERDTEGFLAILERDYGKEFFSVIHATDVMGGLPDGALHVTLG